MNNCN
jgi:hypothetical protein